MITFYDNIWPEIPAVKQNPGLSWALIPTGSEASPEVEEDVLVSSQPLPGAPKQDLEFGTFLEKALQGQNLGLLN